MQIDPVWHSPWNGIELFPQRAVWCATIIAWYWAEPFGSFTAMFLPMIAGMMLASVFQRHRLPEPHHED